LRFYTDKANLPQGPAAMNKISPLFDKNSIFFKQWQTVRIEMLSGCPCDGRLQAESVGISKEISFCYLVALSHGHWLK